MATLILQGLATWGTQGMAWYWQAAAMTAATMAGSYLDNNVLFPQPGQKGPRISDVNIQTSTEGAAIQRVDGFVRIAGNIIWATKFKEHEKTEGGKGMGGQEVTTYSYSISFAVGLCEGVVPKLGRIWADGNLLDMSKCTIRFYQGTLDQTPDPLIEEIEGSGNTPAYRGLCYLVFEDLDLTPFGNRIPQMQVELVRTITSSRPDALENVLPAVNLIPGAGEFVYSTAVITDAIDGFDGGASQVINKANPEGIADVLSSLDDLDSLVPNLQMVSVVVGWFGTDLRAGNCQVMPGVEESIKKTYPESWDVDGVARVDAHLVSFIDDRPAYGGTPSDTSVVALIQELRSRGHKITFYPFVFMDVPSGNSLPNPYSNNASSSGQPAYPWRGRITISPAPGYTGTVDKTSTAATQVNAFFGSAAASNFSVSGTTVHWTGGGDWGYRRMILHYAKLCAAAGGVDVFLIGSELRGLTHSRSASATYPAVTALKQLAADVKAIVGSGCKVGYSADWSEYNNHQTGDAVGAVQFNLDPLWSDANIDFIGIDNYLPLSDWRDGAAHLDYDADNGPTSCHDRAYLQANIRGGEYFDWYYASDADRDAQHRTTITDATYGKQWVWRSKDLWSWWSNFHYDRPSGTESGSHTAWVPQSKPIRFCELGCPAVDKGGNQPNVFYDPKSSESFLPYYSNGQRDDLMQRAFLEAHLNYWTVAANNPTSSVYGGPMLDVGSIAAWCWDARPFPFFPQRSDLWGDAANYDLGHWLNGRMGSVLLADLVAEICEESSFTAYDTSDLSGLVTGFVRNAPMSARDQLTPLMSAFFFDGVETQGRIRFLMRGRPQATAIDEGDLVIDPDGNPDEAYNFIRAQDDDLPVATRLTYIDAGNGYQNGTYTAKRLVGNSNQVLDSSLPMVMDRTQAGGIGDRLLQETWIMRESGTLALPPRMLALDPGDELAFSAGGRLRRVRITQIDDTASRALQLVATDPSIYESTRGPAREGGGSGTTPSDFGRALVVFMDMPALTDADFPRAWAPHVASYADPWPGKVLILKSPTDSNYAIDTTITKPSTIGSTMYDFYSGPKWRWDRVNNLYVQLLRGTLSSTDDVSVFGGANALAIQNQDGYWEIVQFRDAELIGDKQWKLSNLLRGRAGTELQMRSPVPAGARVVVLDETLSLLALEKSQARGLFNWTWGPQGKPISDPAYQKASYQFKAVGLMPLAPCHVEFEWGTYTPNLLIKWFRRDRSPDATLTAPQTPMSEASEQYEIDVEDASGTVLRTIRGLTVTSWLYAVGDQIADFGRPLSSAPADVLHLSIYQLSAVVGRGWPKEVALDLWAGEL